MIYSATALRKDIYSVLDSILETGIPIEVERKGKRLRIIPEERVGRLERLESHQVVAGDSGELPDLHWDDTWNNGILPE
jgi:Ni,Fe-hydrogenase III large subunit